MTLVLCGGRSFSEASMPLRRAMAHKHVEAVVSADVLPKGEKTFFVGQCRTVGAARCLMVPGLVDHFIHEPEDRFGALS